MAPSIGSAHSESRGPLSSPLNAAHARAEAAASQRLTTPGEKSIPRVGSQSAPSPIDPDPNRSDRSAVKAGQNGVRNPKVSAAPRSSEASHGLRGGARGGTRGAGAGAGAGGGETRAGGTSLS